MGTWLEGKELAEKIKQDVKEEVEFYQRTRHQVPGLMGILVGENEASQIYLRSKEKACQALGIVSRIITYPADFQANALKAEIEELNRRDDVDGILVQLPLPAHLNTHEIICAVTPGKDVDGIHPFNLGNLLANQAGPRPCTPAGIIEMLRFNRIPIEGKDAVVIGRSLIVGKPVAALLTNENATVSVCHSKTKDLAEIARRADILIAAMGRPALIQPDFVKPGAAIIDVGISRVSDAAMIRDLYGDDEKRQKDLATKGYTVVGDVHPRAFERAAFMTPVPGGVGLLTVAMLMKNTLDAFKRRRGLR
jgi:methylenetetrahydrofolate dehydrogenase (NADP+)/methenyltetrahydrofolate cyclohydrolase